MIGLVIYNFRILMFNIEVDDAVKRRIFKAPALFHFSKIQIEIVVFNNLFNYPVRGVISLYHYLALLAAPPCPAAYLRKHLEAALISAIIREFQQAIGVDDTYNRHIRKIKPLCHLLGTNQYIDLLFF